MSAIVAFDRKRNANVSLTWRKLSESRILHKEYGCQLVTTGKKEKCQLVGFFTNWYEKIPIGNQKNANWQEKKTKLPIGISRNIPIGKNKSQLAIKKCQLVRKKKNEIANWHSKKYTNW